MESNASRRSSCCAGHIVPPPSLEVDGQGVELYQQSIVDIESGRLQYRQDSLLLEVLRYGTRSEVAMRKFSVRPTLTLRGRTFKGLRGWAGKPTHPPLTDLPIAAYLFAAAF